jgi:hypothetical protein
MSVRITISADAKGVAQTIDQIRDAIKRAGQEGRQFADLDLSHPELAGMADDMRRVQDNLDNLLNARGSIASTARKMFSTSDLSNFLEAQHLAGQTFPNQANAANFLATAGRYAFRGTRYDLPPPPPPPPPPEPKPRPRPADEEEGGGSPIWGAIKGGGLAALGWTAAMAGIRGAKEFATAAYTGAENEAAGADRLLRRTSGVSDSLNSNGMAIDFNNVRDAAMELTKGLQVSSTELLRYANVIGSAGATSTARALNMAALGVGEARGLGADPDTFMRAMGSAIQMGFQGEKFAGIVAEAISQSGMEGRSEEVLQTIQNWTQQQSRVSLSADGLEENTKAYADMFVRMQNGQSPALWGGNAANVLGALNGAITSGGGGGMAGQALTYRAMLGAGIRDPFAMQMQLAGGAFDTVNGKTNFQIVSDELKKEYGPLGDSNRLALAAGTYFGMNPRTAQALMGLGGAGADVGGLDAFLKPYGGIMGVNPTALGDLAKAHHATRDQLDDMRDRLLGRADIPDALKNKDSALYKASSDEDLRSAVTSVLAQSGMEQSEATKVAQSNANLANTITEIGRPLLNVIPQLKDTFASLLTPIARIADWTDRWLQKEDPAGWAARLAAEKVAGATVGGVASDAKAAISQVVNGPPAPSISSHNDWLSKVGAAETDHKMNLYGMIDSTWVDDVNRAAATDPSIASEISGLDRSGILAKRNNPAFQRKIASWHQRNVLKPILDRAHTPATDLAMYAAWHYQNAAPAIMAAGDDVPMEQLVGPAAYAANLTELKGKTAGQWRKTYAGKGFSATSFDGVPVSASGSGGQVQVTGSATIILQDSRGKKLGTATVPLTNSKNGAPAYGGPPEPPGIVQTTPGM